LRETTILSEVVNKRRAKDSSNTTLQKTFRGGSIAIGGANSASSLAARSTRLLVCDEIDRYPAELPGEGNTLAIAMKRTTAYRSRRRIMLLSSPTLAGAPIDVWHKRGDQRRYYVPCPECGTMHPYEWANVVWDGPSIDAQRPREGHTWQETHDPSTARLHCPACDHGIDDAERVAILAGGEWRAEHPERTDKRVVSFHIWEAYSPMSSLFEIVSGFLARPGGAEDRRQGEMHTWQNTTLGEAVSEPNQGEGIESHVLLLRREPATEAIAGGRVLSHDGRGCPGRSPRGVGVWLGPG
jgi:phage terminase large subunit GpA-like protein